jgi:hypothetical protein
MLSAQIQCVVGIDVAKDAHVVCALEAPTGTLKQRGLKIPATAEGYAQLGRALQQVAQHSAASRRAVQARRLVVRTLALHLLDLRARLAELEAAIAQVVKEDDDAQRLQAIPVLVRRTLPPSGPSWGMCRASARSIR